MSTPQHIHPPDYKITAADRALQLQQKPALIWFTGLSGSGKSTLANATETALFDLGFKTYVLDGDTMRGGLCKDLGFSQPDRVENMRRIAEVVKILLQAGIIVVSAFISPFQNDRAMIAQLIGQDNYLEIFVDCPLEVCEQRDVKGLYQKARNGEIRHFTGIDSPYEVPQNPFVTIKTAEQSLENSVAALIEKILPKIQY
jgi:adenylyl-sulfate kinase